MNGDDLPGEAMTKGEAALWRLVDERAGKIPVEEWQDRYWMPLVQRIATRIMRRHGLKYDFDMVEAALRYAEDGSLEGEGYFPRWMKELDRQAAMKGGLS